MTGSSEVVVYTVVEGVARIHFNRPDRLNALDVAMANAFQAAVEQAVNDPQVRVILVSGEGRAFIAGGDLAYFHAAEDKAAAAHALIEPMHVALKALAAAPQLTLGSLKGAVAGGGMSLAMSLDLLIAADDTVFNMAYARVGTSPDCGGSWMLAHLVGPRKALELLVLSDNLAADQALALGLVNKVVPRDQLEPETDALARRLALGAPLAQLQIKSLVRGAYSHSYDQQLDAEKQAFTSCAASQDFAGAVSAFLDKRKFTFSGL